MEWQLEQFLAERVERGRKLLAESEEHRGSTDLQVRGGCTRQAAAAVGSRQRRRRQNQQPLSTFPHPSHTRLTLLCRFSWNRWTSQCRCTAPSCGATASPGRG